jgi:hypothetical protein
LLLQTYKTQLLYHFKLFYCAIPQSLFNDSRSYVPACIYITTTNAISATPISKPWTALGLCHYWLGKSQAMNIVRLFRNGRADNLLYCPLRRPAGLTPYQRLLPASLGHLNSDFTGQWCSFIENMHSTINNFPSKLLKSYRKRNVDSFKWNSVLPRFTLAIFSSKRYHKIL